MSAYVCVFVHFIPSLLFKPLLTVLVCGVYCSELGESRGEDSPSELHTYTHTRRGGSTVARGGQNPASFSYLWPIKSHVIWWLTLMGNG